MVREYAPSMSISKDPGERRGWRVFAHHDDEGPTIETENETRRTRKYNWMEMDGQMARTLDIATLRITPAVLSSIAELDKFKGAWRAIGRILRRIASLGCVMSPPLKALVRPLVSRGQNSAI